MPIRGERFGRLNHLEKSTAGQVEFDLRETTVVGSMNMAGEKLYEPEITVDSGFFAIILRKEPPTPVPSNSATVPLARFRCYVFSGPHAEIPFSLGTLGYPKKGSNLSLDHLTTEMFPIFTCADKSLSDSLSKAKEGTIVVVDYKNRANLSGPIITQTTSFPPLLVDASNSSLVLHSNGKQFSTVAQQLSSQINTTEDQKKFRKQSLAKTNNRSLNLLWPLLNGSVSTNPKSRFGPRILNSGKRIKHAGIDIGAKLGDSIVAVESGKVVRIQRSRSHFYGFFVAIEHKKNGVVFYSRYAHMGRIDVKLNQTVNRGQVIGIVGMTGKSDSPHLHFELVNPCNKRRCAIEPYVHFEKLPGNLP